MPEILAALAVGPCDAAALAARLADSFDLDSEGDAAAILTERLDELVPAAISSAGIVERATPRTLWVGVRASF